MTKIKNTGAYPYKQNPVPNDFVTGSDSEDDGKTVSYKFQDILDLLNSMNGNEVVSYIFAESPVGELDENGTGYFLSENNETNPSNVTKLIVSKEIKTGVDLSDLFNFVENNKDSFLLKLRNISDPNNFVYFEITNIVEDTYQFDFEINIYNANFFSGELIDKSTYTFDFDLAGGTAPDVYSKIVYVNATSPTIATIFDTLNPPVTNDNSLKNDVNNLYVGNDASTWVYVTSPAGYVTRSVTTTDTVPEGSINLYFKTARVLATLLTGISFSIGGAIISTDNILVAFGKIQRQINDIITSIASKQDSLVSGTNIKTVNGTTLLGSGNLNTPDMDTTTAQIVSGVKTFLNLTWGFRNVANTFTSFFTNANTASRTYTFQNRNGTIADDTDLATKQILDTQIEVSANSNVLNAWSGQTILFTSSCTITVPATLNNSLMFPFRTLSGVTVTWAITSPFTWETTPVATPEKTVGHFMRRGSTNTIFLDV